MSRSNARLRALAVSQLATTLLAAAALPFVPSSARAQSATPEAPPQVRLAPPAADNAADEATELAKKLQNPIGDLYSFPFQGNTNFNTGTKGGTQEILNIQPVIPIHINEDFTLITRTILPWSGSRATSPRTPSRSGPRRRNSRRFSRTPTRSITGSLGPARSFRRRPPATRRSAPTSGAPGRRPSPSTSRDPGSPACWSTTSGRSAALQGAAARNTASS